jgi:uncharacterized membrane protein YgaE (UPF0421/DUF939 family)
LTIGKKEFKKRELAKEKYREIRMTLSPRFKHAFKTALAVVIAYAVALCMDWDKPIWAGWTAASVSLDATGQSIQKGLNRITGAVVGAIAGFILLAFFIQDRWLFFLFFSLWVAVCTYFSFGSERYNYFWQQAGFFAVVVGLDSAFSPANAFTIAIERTQGAGTGLLVYLLVDLLLWPVNSHSSLEKAGRQLTASLKALFADSMARLLNRSDSGSVSAPGTQLAEMQRRFDNLLDAAELDSWEVNAMRRAWRRCQAQIADLRDALERWQQDFNELQDLDLVNLVPNLPAFGAEIETRLTEIERMFAGDPPTRAPAPIKLASDEQVRKTLTHFDRAALSVSRHRLAHVEAVTRDLFATVSAIRDLAHHEAAAALRRSAAPFILDRDRLGQALRVAASAWLAFFVIIYVPGVPGELATLGIIIRIVVADTKFAWIPVQALIRPTFAGILVAFPIYVFLEPALSSYAQLAVLLFAFVFVVDYAFHDPKQMLWRILILFLFMLLINLTNVQTYSFLHFANTALQWSLLFVLLSLTEYLPISQQPDHVYRRMLGRFFRSCEFLMATRGWGRQHEPSLAARWRKKFHTYEVATLPGKLAAWGRFLPPDALGRTTPEQVQALAMSLQALSFRMQELTEAGVLHQSDLLVRELLADVRRWRVAVQEIFGQVAEKPETTDPAALQSRLDAVLGRLEARIQDALDRIDAGTVSAEESGNMYRLLGAHRGVSEALVNFAGKTVGIDWTRLREGRF